MPKKDLSKVDTHYTSPVVWPLRAISFFDMHICIFWCSQKRYRRRKGIMIYMIYMFWNRNVFENGYIYIYMNLNEYTRFWNILLLFQVPIDQFMLHNQSQIIAIILCLTYAVYVISIFSFLFCSFVFSWFFILFYFSFINLFFFSVF